MATYPDLSGNSPVYPVDKANQGNYDLQAIQFRGASQVITFDGSAKLSTRFSTRTRAVRLAAEAACRYAIGDNPTATASSALLPAGAVEIVAVKGKQRLSVIQDASGGDLTITEDQ